MSDHPKRIGRTYRGQFARPEDAIREAANEERKRGLEEHQALEPEEMPTAIYNAAFDAEVSRYAAENVAPAGGQMIDDAIAGAVTATDERVKTAGMTPEQKQARAFVDELESRGTVLGDTHFHSDDDEPASPADHAALLAELQEPGDDPVIGYDEAGNTVYEDAETGQQYILDD